LRPFRLSGLSLYRTFPKQEAFFRYVLFRRISIHFPKTLNSLYTSLFSFWTLSFGNILLNEVRRVKVFSLLFICINIVVLTQKTVQQNKIILLHRKFL